MLDHKHNALFVHIPKTGGQSVEHVFLKLNGLTWETRAPLLMRSNADRDKGPAALAHLFAQEYVNLGHVSQETFARLFKFSMVRNPWSRLVSEYYYRKEFHVTFDAFVEDSLARTDLHQDRTRHIVSQTDYLIDTDGRVLVDFIGRMETIDSDFRTIAKRLSLPSDQLPHVNKSSRKTRLRDYLPVFGNSAKVSARKPYQDHYSPALRDRVGEYYNRDIERFGYTFEGSFPSGPISLKSA